MTETPAPIGALRDLGLGDAWPEHPPIPAGLLDPARAGDANAVRLIADWFREQNFPDYAAWCAVLAEEMALDAALATHLHRLLGNVERPKRQGRASQSALVMLLSTHAGLGPMLAAQIV